MGAYRPDRNIKTSIKDYITAQLVLGNWTDVTTVMAFPEGKKISLPCISIRISSSDHEPTGVGESSTTREAFILINVFGTSHTQASDLKDFLVSVLKKSFDYNEYTVVDGVSSFVLAGKVIPLLPIKDLEENSGQDKSNLSKVDRNKFLISFNARISIVEA